MPHRWRSVPDEERPARWRQARPTDHQAQIETQGTNLETQQPSTQVTALQTANDLVSFCQEREASDSLVVLKLYSKRCRACNMIAPMYKRLARNHADALDCFEVECQANLAARPLVETLGVEALPSIVVFDPVRVTRVYSCSLAPAEFKAVEAKVAQAVRCMRGRRTLMRRRGDALRAAMVQAGAAAPREEPAPEPACVCVDDSVNRVTCIPPPVPRASIAGAWLGKLQI